MPLTDADDIDFGKQIRSEKITRWRQALADYGFDYALVAGKDAVAALAAAELEHAGGDVTPVIMPPGDWNSEPITPAGRTTQAKKEIESAPPTAARGRAYLEEQAVKWRAHRKENPNAPDLTLFDRLTPPTDRPPKEDGPWLLKDFVWPSMERVLWDEVAIVLVPTPHPHEVPVYLDWGNWNDVPPSVDLASVALHWQERHGARLIGVGNDQLEFSIAQRPSDFAQAAGVFREHFLFGPDPVEFKPEALARYSAELIDADTWVFWFD